MHGNVVYNKIQENVPLLRTNESIKSKSNLNEEGKCKFGTREYWDAMYTGKGDRPASSYSWYCQWPELEPFFKELVPDKSARILVPGIGNDPTPVEMYDAGYNDMIAFDYVEAAVDRAKIQFGPDRKNVRIMVADATSLPLPNGSVDATLDKGTLDAIRIADRYLYDKSVQELSRVTAEGGVVVCVSRVIEAEEWLEAFSPPTWETIHNGELAFTENGEATIDLGADLYSFRRTGTQHHGEKLSLPTEE